MDQRNHNAVNILQNKHQQTVKVLDPQFRLTFRTIYKIEGEVSNIRFDVEDQYLAVGSSNGTVCVIDSSKEYPAMSVLWTGQPSVGLKFPTTAVRWRSSEFQSKNKYILITSNADGTVTHWNSRTGQALTQFKEADDNEIFALDLNRQETHFATAGKDCKVRIYDEETNQLVSTLAAIQWTNPGHNNRIFSVKFNPLDGNVLLSGGWDQNILIWDLRESRSVGTILGPKIAGDAIDIQDGRVLTGSNKMSEQLQLWDLGTQKMIQNLTWDPHNASAGAFVFTCQFGKTPKSGLFGAVASGTNEVKLFEERGEKVRTEANISGFKNGMYGFDFANLSNRFAFGGGDGLVGVASINKNEK